jgi:hypothetical protein
MLITGEPNASNGRFETGKALFNGKLNPLKCAATIGDFDPLSAATDGFNLHPLA